MTGKRTSFIHDVDYTCTMMAALAYARSLLVGEATSVSQPALYLQFPHREQKITTSITTQYML